MTMTTDVSAAVIRSDEQIYKLLTPITDAEGKRYTEFVLVEPELRHLAQAQRVKTATDGEDARAILATVADIPIEVAGKIKTRDARALKRIIDSMIGRGVALDIVTEKAELARNKGIPAPLVGQKTFTLLSPVPTDGEPLVSITVTEPDIDAGIAVERMKTSAEQTAALIARCSGQVIPLILRMKMCDVARLERWFDFFLNDGEEIPPDPTKSAS